MRHPSDFHVYVAALNAKERFVTLRYGDGEWACILGKPGGNCNGEDYTPALRDALIRTLKEPLDCAIWYGSDPGAKLRAEVDAWIAKHGLERLSWTKKCVFTTASVEGRLGPFIAAVKAKRTLLIGPTHLARPQVRTTWGIDSFVPVPAHNAFIEFNRTIHRATEAIARCAPELVICCSGMAAEPTIHTLAKGCDASFIDMGAVLDPYAGVCSRQIYRQYRHRIDALMNKNKE